MRQLLGFAASTSLRLSSLSQVAPPAANAKPIQCPDTWTGTKCEYYKDGYKAGKGDR